MVSSELVVLLIVCVGINTGSAQQGELYIRIGTFAYNYHCTVANKQNSLSVIIIFYILHKTWEGILEHTFVGLLMYFC